MRYQNATPGTGPCRDELHDGDRDEDCDGVCDGVCECNVC